MKDPRGLENLAHLIIDSYEVRVGRVDDLIAQANDTLSAFTDELGGMIARLKETLARSTSLRKRDFDLMMETLLEDRRRIEADARTCLLRFQEQEQEMVAQLRGIVSGKGGQGLSCVRAIREDILKRQRAREAEVAVALKRFQIVEDELRAGMMSLLARGSGVRTRDLRAVVRMLKARRQAREDGMDQILEDMEGIRGRVAQQWHANGFDGP